MKKLIRIIAIMLLSALMISAFAGTAGAAGTEEKKTTQKAEIMNVKGGANGIVTFTFDDGYWATANAVNEICKKYSTDDVKVVASLMMIAKDIEGKTAEINQWNGLFAEGYLGFSSHGYGSSGTGTCIQNGETAGVVYPRELKDSKTILESAFGSIVSYASGQGQYAAAAHTYVIENRLYFSHRSTQIGIQPLNPGIGSSAGQWHMLYVKRPQHNPDYNGGSGVTDISVTKADIDTVATQGGWLITLQHGIAGDHSYTECTKEQTDELFGYAAAKAEQGLVWFATLDDATKYIREFQNSTVSHYTTSSGRFVELTMAETTADGLTLDEEIFNLPLTVKVELPTGWKSVTYKQGAADAVTVETFVKGGKTYAYIDLVPNGEKAELTNPADPTEYVSSMGMKQRINVTNDVDIEIAIPTTETKVSKVILDGEEAEGVVSDGYTVYSIENIFVTDIMSTHTLSVEFVDGEYDPWVTTVSAMAYLKALATAEGVSSAEKTLGFDFLTYAKEAYSFLNTTKDENGNDVLPSVTAYTDAEKLYTDAGVAHTSIATAPTSCDMGTLSNALSGAAFTLNEKPYYLFYLKEGFTGTLTVGGEEFKVVNGYYHCRKYVIYEVDSVSSLLNAVEISANGKIAGNAVTASGSYSFANYYNNLGASEAPAYVKALYAYVLSAKAN